MFEIRKTDEFAKWIDGLRDTQARARILVRIQRMSSGLLGDVKPIGEGLSELRIHFAAGYRIYFKQIGNQLIILLAGGDKQSQAKDIQKAKQLAKGL